MNTFDLIIPCAIGVEKYLGNELKKGDYNITDKEPGRFMVQTDLPGTYKLLRSTRLAERVLLEFASFKALDLDQLYQGIRNSRWQDLIPLQAKIHLEKVRVTNCKVKAISTIQSIAQRAISDTILKYHKVETMPETGAEILIRIYARDDYFRVCIDLSGEALHKRGWRTKSGVAPIKETIAANMLTANVWRRKTPLYDPFCGSGTIILEALAYAANLAPNLYRPMAISNLSIHDRALDEKIQEELASRANFENVVRLHGSDKDPAMIEIAKENLDNFCKTYRLNQQAQQWVKDSVQFYQKPVESAKPWDEDGLVLFNPPFGERLEDLETAKALYKTFPNLRKIFGTWAFSFISSSNDVASIMAQKTAFARHIHNGALEMTIYRFDPLTPRSV